MRVTMLSLLLMVMVLVGCRVDETAIDVIADSQGVRFQFHYIVQSDQPVKVLGLIVQESKSEATVWELEALSSDETNDDVTNRSDDKKSNKKIAFTSLSAVSFGSVPTGFKQVTPAEQHEVHIRHGVKYRVLALAERGSGMTEFTLKGECQKIPFTTFSKDMPEFKQPKDC